MRLADDSERVDIMAERCQRRYFTVVELPNEYSAIQTPTEPVFLYRFTAELPDGDVVWRFTSHPSDVTVSGATWLAVGIEHSRLSRSTRLGGGASITADYDSVEPMRLCVPLRIAVPLRMEILQTTTALGTPEVVLDGTIRKPELNGRSITASCVEWGDAMEQKIPTFLIERDCNYQVYEPNTCKSDLTLKKKTVSITAVSGRSVTITGSGLSGLAVNWFAYGWIELGSGLSQIKRFIVSSTSASGTTIVLTTTETIDVDLPATATAVPGCDGLRATCGTKFNNLDNFGGHETPRENLTFAAVKTETKGGKK